MLCELEQVCQTCSTESSSGMIEFDSNLQRIFVTALTFLLNQVIATVVAKHCAVLVIFCLIIFFSVDVNFILKIVTTSFCIGLNFY